LKDPKHMKKLCIYMPDNMFVWIENQARKYAISRSAVVKQLIAGVMEKEGLSDGGSETA